MPIRGRLTTKGFEDYLERIVAAGRDIETVAPEMLNAGAQVLVEGMQDRAPKDTHNLEKNIGASEVKQEGYVFSVEVGIKKEANAETHRYALAQEYGWADHRGAKAGKPYIRPTLDGDMGKARAAMRKVAKKRGTL